MVELLTVAIIGGVILFTSATCTPVVAFKIFGKDSLLEQAKSCLHEG